MSDTASRFVVSADWLQQRLADPAIRILDASFYLPAHKRDAEAEYAAGHIPGAIRFDQDRIADHSTPLPHMVPTPEAFAEEVGRLGISDRHIIVVYDGIGLFASPRGYPEAWRAIRQSPACGRNGREAAPRPPISAGGRWKAARENRRGHPWAQYPIRNGSKPARR